MVEVRGRVVAPDGRPVPGATLRTTYLNPADPTELTTAPDGRFVSRIPRTALSTGTMINRTDTVPWITATAPGFGPGWAAGVLRPDAPREVTIRLVEDGPPIEGRIVDLEGHPVAGARVKAEHLWFAGDEHTRYIETRDLAAWLRRVQERGIHQGPWDGLEPLPTAIAAATTDRDGRFRLAGIGRERIAELVVSGPTISTTLIYAMCHDGPEVRAIDRDPAHHATIVLHTPRFEHAVAPTQPIEGVIRDKDTGRPLAGMRLRAAVYREYAEVWVPDVETTSDARGALSPHRLEQGAGVSIVGRAGRGPALSQRDPPRTRRIARPGADPLRHRTEAGHPGPGPCHGQGDRPAGAGHHQRLHLSRQSSCPRVPRL
jgi:hypothetical protein